MPPEVVSRSPSTVDADTTGQDEASFSDHETSTSSETDAYERRRAKKRYVIVAISFVILAACAAFMIQAGIFHLFFGKDMEDSKTHDFDLFRSHIQSFCSATEFQDICVSSIEDRAKTQNDGGGSSSDKALFLISMEAAVADIEKARDYSASLLKERMEERAAAAFRDCEELLTNAAAELKSSCETIDSLTPGSAPFKMSGALSAISASISFQRTCSDGIPPKGGDPVARMRKMVKNATEETRNNLALVTMYPLDLPHGSSKRGLLGDAEEEKRLWRGGGESPTVVVAQDGSGDYRTIGEALKEAVERNGGRFVICVKEGVYKENVRVTREMQSVTMYGDGMDRTVVVGSKAFGDGDTVYQTATFAVSGPAFMARNMGFVNHAGPGKAQAVALRVESDLSVFYNCSIDGYQNALLALAHRQFFRNCLISGSVDVITGDAAAMFQNCNIHLKKPLPEQSNTVTAHARVDSHEPTGIVMQNCTIAASPELYPVKDQMASYLGRPAGEFSVAVIMETMIEDVIRSEGWAEPEGWVSRNATGSAYLAELDNRGPGSGVLQRVAWPAHRILRDSRDAARFTVDEFITGAWWLSMTGVPFYTGMAWRSKFQFQ